MAWSHCEGCGEGLPMPTNREVMEGTQRCPCGVVNDPRRTPADVIEEQDERIEALEERLARLEKHVVALTPASRVKKRIARAARTHGEKETK